MGLIKTFVYLLNGQIYVIVAGSKDEADGVADKNSIYIKTLTK